MSLKNIIELSLSPKVHQAPLSLCLTGGCGGGPLLCCRCRLLRPSLLRQTGAARDGRASRVGGACREVGGGVRRRRAHLKLLLRGRGRRGWRRGPGGGKTSICDKEKETLMLGLDAPVLVRVRGNGLAAGRRRQVEGVLVDAGLGEGGAFGRGSADGGGGRFGRGSRILKRITLKKNLTNCETNIPGTARVSFRP